MKKTYLVRRWGWNCYWFLMICCTKKARPMWSTNRHRWRCRKFLVRLFRETKWRPMFCCRQSAVRLLRIFERAWSLWNKQNFHRATPRNDKFREYNFHLFCFPIRRMLFGYCQSKWFQLSNRNNRKAKMNQFSKNRQACKSWRRKFRFGMSCTNLRRKCVVVSREYRKRIMWSRNRILYYRRRRYCRIRHWWFGYIRCVLLLFRAFALVRLLVDGGVDRQLLGLRCRRRRCGWRCCFAWACQDKRMLLYSSAWLRRSVLADRVARLYCNSLCSIGFAQWFLPPPILIISEIDKMEIALDKVFIEMDVKSVLQK